MQQRMQIHPRQEQIRGLSQHEENPKKSILFGINYEGERPNNFCATMMMGGLFLKIREQAIWASKFQKLKSVYNNIANTIPRKSQNQTKMDTKSNSSLAQSKFDDVFNFVDLIIEKIADPSVFQDMVKDASSRYKLDKYKTNKITLKEFKALLSRKYLTVDHRNIEHPKICHDDKWHKKQLLAFIWFIVGFSYAEQTTIQNLSQEKWEIISTIFNGKSINFLQYEARCLEKFNMKFKKWESQESQILANLIKIKNGKWKEISKMLFQESNKRYFRTSKQCREHWINYLDDSKQKNAWTPEEEIKLLIYVQIFGKKWAQISKIAKNRTQHSIKNQFRLIMKKFSGDVQQDDDQLQHIIGQICQLEKFDRNQLMQRVMQTIEKEPSTSQEKQTETDRKMECQQDEISEFEQIENLIFSYQENKFKQRQIENIWMGLVQEDIRQQIMDDQKVICFEFNRENRQAMLKQEVKLEY